MANATTRVGKGANRRDVEFFDHSVKTLSAATTFYSHAMVGLTTGGYLDKFDDTQSLQFWGVVSGKEGDAAMPISTAGDGLAILKAHQAPTFELAITSVAITDIGRKVYALFDNQGTLDAGATTYGNLVGTVKDLLYAMNTATPVSNMCLVEGAYLGKTSNAALGATRTLAATGAQTLTKLDLNKVILVPSTGAYALTLPAVADTQAGDRLEIIKTTSNAVILTLTGNAAETIDGSNTLTTIDAQYDTAILVSTGTAWVVLARDIT